MIDSLISDTTFNCTLQEMDTMVIQITNEKDKISTFCGVNADTWAAIIIPIAIFILGLIFAYTQKKISSRNKFKSIQEYFFTWIELIDPKVREQTEAYEKMSESIYLFEKVESAMRFNLHIDKFYSFSNEDILKTFVTSRSGDISTITQRYFDLINNLSFIKQKQENAFSNYDLIKSLGKDIVNEWNKNIQELHTFRNNWFYKNRGSSDILPFYEILRTFIDNKNDSLIGMVELYLNPSGELCHDFLQKKGDNQDVLEYLRLISSLQINYEKRKANSEIIMDSLIQCKESTEVAWDKVLKTKEYYKSIRFKLII